MLCLLLPGTTLQSSLTYTISQINSSWDLRITNINGLVIACADSSEWFGYMPNSLRSQDQCKIDTCFEAIKKIECA